MDLSKLSKVRCRAEPLDLFFQEYVRLCKPKNKQKANFGRLLGYKNYTEMRQDVGSWNESCVSKVEGRVKALNDDGLMASFIYTKFYTMKEPSFGDCVDTLMSVGLINQRDYQEFITQGPNAKLPISFLNAIESELSGQVVTNLKLNSNDAEYFVSCHWNMLGDHDKVAIVPLLGNLNSMSLNHISKVHSEMVSFYNKALFFQHGGGWRSEEDPVEDNLKLTSRILCEQQRLTPEMIFESVKGRLSEKHDEIKDDSDLFILFARNFGLVEQQDLAAIDFFERECQETSISAKKRRRQLMYAGLLGEVDETQDSRSLDHILRNKSPLTSPVLATYLLHHLGEPEFSLERLYSFLYVIQKEPTLAPLCKLLEPIEDIRVSLRFNDGDLKNPLIAAFLMASRAQNISSNNGIKDYVELLNHFVACRIYPIVLAEASRFIEIGALFVGGNVFSSPFSIAYHYISNEELSGFPQSTIDAIAIFAAKERFPLEKIESLVSESSRELFDALKDSSNVKLIEKRSESSDTYQTFMNDKRRHRIQRYGHEDYSANGGCMEMFWALCASGANFSYLEKEIEFLPQFSNRIIERGRGRNSSLHISTDGIPKKYAKILDNLKAKGVDTQRFIDDELIMLDLMFRGNVSSKKAIIKIELDHSVGIVVDKELHCFLSFPFSDMMQAIIDFGIETISIHESYSLNYDYQQGEYDNWRHVVKGLVERQIRIDGVDKATVETILQLDEVMSRAKLDRFNGYNPVSSVAKELSPQFYFMNKLMNAEGIDYTQS